MVQLLTYIQIEWEKKRILFLMYWLIDDWNSARDHGKIETDYLHFGFDIRMITWRQINHTFYYYVDQSNGISIVK